LFSDFLLLILSVTHQDTSYSLLDFLESITILLPIYDTSALVCYLLNTFALQMSYIQFPYPSSIRRNIRQRNTALANLNSVKLAVGISLCFTTKALTPSSPCKDEYGKAQN
jgi:hypothetical protein